MSRNIGIANASGDVVAFLDDDAVPEPSWLNRLEAGYDAPNVGGVGGFIRDHTGANYQVRVVVSDRMGDTVGYPNSEAAQVAHRPGGDRFFSLTGCNSSFRRTVLAEIGGFDEEYAYFLDETDVCVRVVDAGYDLRVVGTAQVHHRYAESHLRNQERVPKSLYLPVRSKAYFSVKFQGVRNLHQVFDRLYQFKSDLARDNKWLQTNGKIAVEDQHRLDDEVDLGIVDGIRDAFQFPAGKHWLPRHQPRPDSTFSLFDSAASKSGRLRLCFVSREYPPGPVGGIGRWTQLVAEGLAARGHTVSVVSLAMSGHTSVDYVNGVWVHRIVPVWHSNRSQPSLPDLPQSVKDHCYSVFDEVMRIKALRGVDLVSYPIWDLEGLAITTSQAIPSVMSLHTSHALALPFKSDWHANPKYLRGHVQKVISGERSALMMGMPLLANSYAVVADLEKAYGFDIDPARVRVVPHGVPDPGEAESARDRVPERVNVLFVGRFEGRKGIDLLFEAAPALLEEFADVTFRFVGDDEIEEAKTSSKREFLKRHEGSQWLSRVIFSGKVSDDELSRAYREADIFVAPSRYESFGLIFAEAFSYGKPAVGISVGGVPEVVRDGRDGVLIKEPDAVQLRDALRALVVDRSLRKSMGAAGRHSFERNFTIERMLDGAERAYLEWSRPASAQTIQTTDDVGR